MRYMNWDVLVFPETGDTKTPLQEFSTACTVIQDPDSAAIPISSHAAYFKTVTHPLPTVSCFIPSLLPGSPFRVSIHSWASPVASRATQAMAAQGNQVWFEAKVLLDGYCTAGILFNQDPSWPQVIATEDVKKQEQLKFPTFHAEMLTQIWVNAAQGKGTLRIVIAEGIRQGQGTAGFLKLRNIVTFSFQHAPLHVLENCGIAWPNPGMWWQGQQQFHDISSPRAEAVDAEAHGHSPRRRQASKDSSRARAESVMAPPHMSQGLTAHPAFRARAAHSNDPFWSQHGPMHDPFTGAANPTAFYKTVATRNTTGTGDISMPDQSRSTSSSHDESMPDYSRPLSPANSHRSHPMPDYSRPPTLPGSRNISDFANSAMNELGLSRLESMLQSHPGYPGYDAENQFEAMMASISPRRDSNLSGISAPSNTRASSAANTPPPGTVNPYAAQDRVSSYGGHARSASVTTRDPPPPAVHVLLGCPKASSDSLGSDVRQDIREVGLQPETIVKKRPVGRPKGRKEGKTSETSGLEIPVSKAQRRATTGSTNGKENTKGSVERISDGKRKRVTTAAGPRVALDDRLANQDASSPTRKASKTGPKGDSAAEFIDMDDLTAEGVVAREPLGTLENRI